MPKLGNLHDYRGFAGRMASGTFTVGDEVIAYPSGDGVHHHRHPHLRGTAEQAIPQLSYSITLADEIDTSRGGMIVKASEPTQTAQEFDAMIAGSPTRKRSSLRARFHLRHTTNDVRAIVTDVLYKVEHLHAEEAATT